MQTGAVLTLDFIADVASDPQVSDDVSAGLIVAIVAGVAVVLVAIGLYARRRKSRPDA